MQLLRLQKILDWKTMPDLSNAVLHSSPNNHLRAGDVAHENPNISELLYKMFELCFFCQIHFLSTLL
jgi:hypothetical protein